jgi:hypothetical protein
MMMGISKKDEMLMNEEVDRQLLILDGFPWV